MTSYEDTEDDKNENGDGANKLESKNLKDDERKVGPGSPRNTEEPTDSVVRFYYSSHEQMGDEYD